MSQSKLGSFIEAITNTAIGFFITMTFLPIINYLCHISMSVGQASLSTFLFTILSVARGYIIRRFFNGNIARSITSKFTRDTLLNDSTKPWNYRK